MNRLASACLCLVVFVCPARAAVLVPDDFAAGFALPEAHDAGLHALDLPAAVYEKTVRPDLADVRIFNGDGEMVPHVVRPVAEHSEEVRQTVPFFPLPGKQSPPNADLSLQVSLQADGAVLAVNADNKHPAAPKGAYLLDLSKWNGAGPTALELHWRSPAAGLLTLSLMHSSDLTHWSTLVDRAALANLSYQGSQVVARRIPLAERPLPYIRLDCADCREPLLLNEVIALAGQPVTGSQWQWTRLRAEQTATDQGQTIVAYRLGAKMAVGAVQLRFPASNSLLRAAIEARAAADKEWRQVVRADFYRLDLEGASLRNPLATCPPVSAPEWRIRAIADHAGLGNKNALPELELGWPRQEILFLSRGPGPYTLAYGSAKAEAAAGQDNLVLAALRDTGSETHVRRIEAGAPVSLGGDQALQADRAAAPAVSWRKIVLWLVLVGGVGLLALMARQLLREMRAKAD